MLSLTQSEIETAKHINCFAALNLVRQRLPESTFDEQVSAILAAIPAPANVASRR